MNLQEENDIRTPSLMILFSDCISNACPKYRRMVSRKHTFVPHESTEIADMSVGPA